MTWTLDTITDMKFDQTVFSGHAIQRMFERGIRARDVEEIVENGEVIVDYPDDTPLPSCLILGFVEDRAIHVVAAMEHPTRTCYVITVYCPNPDLWDPAFRRRRQP